MIFNRETIKERKNIAEYYGPSHNDSWAISYSQDIGVLLDRVEKLEAVIKDIARQDDCELCRSKIDAEIARYNLCSRHIDPVTLCVKCISVYNIE